MADIGKGDCDSQADEPMGVVIVGIVGTHVLITHLDGLLWRAGCRWAEHQTDYRRSSYLSKFVELVGICDPEGIPW